MVLRLGVTSMCETATTAYSYFLNGAKRWEIAKSRKATVVHLPSQLSNSRLPFLSQRAAEDRRPPDIAE